MRIAISLVASAAALAAAPALAQINVGLGGQGGAGLGVQVPGASVGGAGQVGTQVGVGVDTRGTIGSVTGRLDSTVNRVDRTVNSTLDRDLRLATSADLTAGAVVRDNRGHRIGTVQSVHGNTAMIVNAGRMFHVPISALYRGSKGLVTSLTRTQIQASATAQAGAHVHN